MKRRTRLPDRALQALDAAYAAEPDFRINRRIRAVRLASSGSTLDEAARVSGLARSEVAKWKKRYLEEGITALILERRGGERRARTRIDENTGKQLIKGLQKKSFCSVDEIRQWLASTAHVKITSAGVRSWLQRHNWNAVMWQRRFRRVWV